MNHLFKIITHNEKKTMKNPVILAFRKKQSKIFHSFLFFSLFVVSAYAQLDSLSFGLIADPQYAEKTSKGRCYDGSLAKIKEAVSVFNQQELPFLIILGDIIEGNVGGDGSQTTKELTDIRKELDAFNGEIYALMGNHDLVDIDKAEWLDILNPKIKRNYYSFNAGNYHFVVLDANYTEEGLDYGKDVNWVWTDTWIHQEQQDWLKADLDSASDRPSFIFVHQNLQDNGALCVNNAPEIRNILETYGNVTHVFQGHHHGGQYTQINGIHYLTLQGMVTCPDSENRFSTATIKEDLINIDGHGAQPDFELQHAGLLEIPIPKTISLLNLHLEQSWPKASTQTIEWKTTGDISSVDLYYKETNDTTLHNIAMNISNANSYNWTIPKTMPATIQLVIRADDLLDQSNTIELTPLNANITYDAQNSIHFVISNKQLVIFNHITNPDILTIYNTQGHSNYTIRLSTNSMHPTYSLPRVKLSHGVFIFQLSSKEKVLRQKVLVEGL